MRFSSSNATPAMKSTSLGKELNYLSTFLRIIDMRIFIRSFFEKICVKI